MITGEQRSSRVWEVTGPKRELGTAGPFAHFDAYLKSTVTQDRFLVFVDTEVRCGFDVIEAGVRGNENFTTSIGDHTIQQAMRTLVERPLTPEWKA